MSTHTTTSREAGSALSTPAPAAQPPVGYDHICPATINRANAADSLRMLVGNYPTELSPLAIAENILANPERRAVAEATGIETPQELERFILYRSAYVEPIHVPDGAELS